MTVYVVLNGEKTVGMENALKGEKSIYCADGGANYLYEYGIIPKIIMGDMDSISPSAKEYYQNQGCEFETFPTEKDETDGQLIVDRALLEKPDSLIILCGLGGRIDHFFGNVQLLYRIAKQGITAKMIGNNSTVMMSKKEIVIEKKDNQLVTIIPYEDNTVLTLSGFRYNVNHFKFEKDTPIGLSNYLVDDFGKIEINEGCPVVIVTSDIK